MIREPLTLRAARVMRAQSQESLAEVAQVNRRTIAGIELGEHVPKLLTRRKLAQALGFKPWQIAWSHEKAPECAN